MYTIDNEFIIKLFLENMETGYFRIDRDRVLFNYVEKFESGEDDCLHGEFDLREYRRGINKLNGSGNCELSGKDCSMKIFSKRDLIDIIFFGCNKTFFIDGLQRRNLA